MAYRTSSSEHLQALLDALMRPVPTRGLGVAATKYMRQIAAQGWATPTTIEDLLLVMDRRLDPFSACAPEALAAMFDLPWRNVAYRPPRLAVETVLYQAMAASDVAQLLIHLEACGFAVDPAPLATALITEVRQRRMLNASELSVLRFERWRHKGPPMTIRAPGDAVPALPEQHGSTPSGYRIEGWRCFAGNFVRLDIHAPRFRRRKPPVETVCADCGATWWRGDPESSAIHRREHRDRMSYLHPQPHAEVMKAVEQGQDPSWVTTNSPAWQHREMYDRALAFKRELRYSFVQWGSESGDNDPDVHGFLFLDACQAIVGACAFRLRSNEIVCWWRLQWIWISPEHRRQGHLARHWDQFRQRFGHFEVESPVSEAMSSFLAKRGDSHLASEFFDVVAPG